jgi:uncharacterized protein (TIGR02186 family)
VIASFRHIATPVAVLLLSSAPAGAQQVIATVAPSTISIGANYSGGSIVVFGAIAKGQPGRSYDAVVTVIGPRQDLLVRRKERVLGIWVNRHSQSFSNVPSFLAVFANRSFDAITQPDTLRQHRLGLKYATFIDRAIDENDPFEQNLIHARIDEGLYIEQQKGVSFVSPSVFRTEIPMPKNALTGVYDIDLKILANGALVAQTKAVFNVEKIGLAQFVVKSSVDHSLAYGLATLGMALLTGWIGSVAFRRG